MNKTYTLENGAVVEAVGDIHTKTKEGGALLGSSGKGTVLMVKDCETNQLHALKLYNSPLSKEIIERLRGIIKSSLPGSLFIKPLSLVKQLGSNGDVFGYLMPLCDESKYKTLEDMCRGKIMFSSKRTQIKSLLNIVPVFEMLHAMGYCFKTLNDVIIINPKNGDILIRNIDSVCCQKENDLIDNVIHITNDESNFLAPEVRTNYFDPDKHSDRFSLAVLMFYLLTRSHPFDGVAKNVVGSISEIEDKIYGTNPVFIFHPTDASNRPDPSNDKNAIVSWPLMPKFIQDLFVKTFTAGMPSGKNMSKAQIDALGKERQQRTSELDWRKALLKWYNLLIGCPKCGYATWGNIDDNGQILSNTCVNCNKKIDINKPIFLLNKNRRLLSPIILDEGKEIMLPSSDCKNLNKVIGIVVRSSKNKDVYGIKNLSNSRWKVSQNKIAKSIDNDEVLIALENVNVDFDAEYSGKIRYKL